MKSTNYQQQGFTIIELLVATAAFSVILLVCTLALVQVGNLYYKGVTNGITQSLTQNVMDELSRQIQFSYSPQTGHSKTYTIPGTLPTPFTVQSFCLGSHRYSYMVGPQLNDGAANGYDPTNVLIRHVLWRDQTTDSNCTPLDLSQANPSAGIGTSTNGTELMGPNTRLSMLTLTPVSGDLWQIDVGVAYGSDQLTPPIKLSASGSTYTVSSFLQCKSGLNLFGGELCSVYKLETIIRRRVT